MSIESLGRRIKTTRDLRDIVVTMKSLSSVSILQYEHAQESLMAYTKNIRNAFHGLIKMGAIDTAPHPINDLSSKTVVIVIGSDNGLVGKFNKEIIQESVASLKRDNALEEASFITIGKRTALIAEQQKLDLAARYAISNSIKAINSIASTVIIKMEEVMRERRAIRVLLFYHKRMHGAPTTIERIRLLPFPTRIYKELKEEPWPTNNIPMATMDTKELIDKLIKEYLMMVVSSAITMSLTAEHHTRMINMQNAEKNIDKSLESMSLEYQQKRQEAITEELIDVVSGSNALQKKKKTA